MILKPTIVGGQWVYRPAPIQDLPWLSRLAAPARRALPGEMRAGAPGRLKSLALAAVPSAGRRAGLLGLDPQPLSKVTLDEVQVWDEADHDATHSPRGHQYCPLCRPR